ncbi:MAG TPA: response regulator [Phenylobacterium sp.]|jgi:DNA-binding NarL/FixJ family response regulator
MKTCLICDDHEMMREALASAVARAAPGVRITQAPDFPSAWAAAAASRPDMIISDLVMPGAGPVEGVRRLIETVPGVPVLVVTGNEDDDLLLALLQIGVAGFAPKSTKSAVIKAAIGLVMAGGRYLPPRIYDLAMRGVEAGATYAAPVTARLTDRQVEVLKMIAAGQSNKEIARVLELSPATIKAHAAAAIAALGAANRTEAVLRARGVGII